MGNMITLKAADGHSLDAYVAPARGTARGGVVVIQEIFGVNSHIKGVVDQYAAEGYHSIAPALFDRVKRDVTVPYTDIQAGIDYVMKLKDDQTLLDMKAAIDHVKPSGKVCVIGYCWGGTLSYLSASRLEVAGAVSYYGGFIPNYLDEKLRVPVIFHFGDKDAHIPMSTVEKIKAAHPQQTYYIYAADHGFNCNDRPSYDAPSAKLAFERSIAFLRKQVG